MRIGIYYNDEQVEFATANALAEKVFAAGSEAVFFSLPEAITGVDRLIVLGGDGTVLRAAKTVSEERIPIVAVNFGRLGFLTEFERKDVLDAVALVLKEDCAVLERSMLEVELNGAKVDCLNECAVLRGVLPQADNRVVRISVHIGGSSAGEIAADGLIVCTPTGSTAYSLSAGGNIMTPDCKAFMLTPVCAFSMRSRPITYSDENELNITLPKDKHLFLYGDGVFLGEVREGDSLTVRKSPHKCYFLTRDKSDYFRRLTEKLN